MSTVAAELERGLAAHRAGKLEEAAEIYRHAIDLSPDFVEAYSNYGLVLSQLGRLDDAAAVYERALAIRPDYVSALINLGALLRDHGKPAESLPYLERAAALAPNSLAAHGNLGNALKDEGRLDEAIASYQRAVALDPNSAGLHNNLGLVLQKMGDIGAAIGSFRKAVSLRPKAVGPQRNLLSALLFDPESSPDAIVAEHRRFGQVFNVAAPARAWQNAPEPDRPLRVGFVSSDFHDHPVARNLLPILAGIDRSRFRTFLYAEVGVRDAVTDQCAKLVDGWREITNIGDAPAADLVRGDLIDVLFLLAGRYDRNRPLIAVYRPAPVQVSLFDPATSGLDGIDYLLADPLLVPADERRLFTERVVRLPSYYVNSPLTNAPPVSPAPSLRNGFVTFGSCNKPSKLNDDVLKAWAELMARVPNARLLLKYRNQFASSAVRRRLETVLGSATMARVQLNVEMESFTEHLATYDRIDIALDTFPFPGSTTTFEALWMGVPVVTICGSTMSARLGASALHAAGLDELIAPDRARYLALAADMASRPERIATYRQSLRSRVESSRLCDSRGYVRHFERVLRAMWHRWCADVTHG
jgi:predicted O-linked N-acetylglucosamine transferase (SPINDLY family)